MVHILPFVGSISGPRFTSLFFVSLKVSSFCRENEIFEKIKLKKQN